MTLFLAVCPTQVGCGHRDAHALLERLYRRVTGRPMPALQREDRGKPYWPGSSWHLSISHTNQLAFCAVADCPIGLDAEPLGRRFSPRLPEKVLSPEELQPWNDGGRDPETFLTLWTLKEAAVKFSGRGLQGYPSDLSFELSLPQPGLRGSGLHFRVLHFRDHVVSLCAAEAIGETAPEIMSIEEIFS